MKYQIFKKKQQKKVISQKKKGKNYPRKNKKNYQ